MCTHLDSLCVARWVYPVRLQKAKGDARLDFEFLFMLHALSRASAPVLEFARTYAV